MKKAFLVILMLFVNPIVIFSNIDDPVLISFKYMVYLDQGNFIENSVVRNGIIDKYKVYEIPTEGLNIRSVKVFKLAISDSCNCFYYVAYDDQIPHRIYKLKGFVSNDFLFFFNSVLMENVQLKQNNIRHDSYKSRRKYILDNITISGLDIKELYNYYSNFRKKKFYSKDIYSCYEKTIETSY